MGLIMDERRVSEAQVLLDLALVVEDLAVRYRTSERWSRRASRELPAFADEGVRLPRLPLREVSVVEGPGLIEQLRVAAGVKPSVVRPVNEYDPALGYRLFASASELLEAAAVAAIRYDEGGHSKPTSRPPGSMVALEVLTDVQAGAAALRRHGRHELGRGAGRRGSCEEDLFAVRGLAHDLGGKWAERALRSCRSWASAARVALSYEAPIAELKISCPDCGGRLLVRSDASSDVWCGGGGGLRDRDRSGRGRFEGPAREGEVWPIWQAGCGVRYPQVSWLLLLEQAASG